MPNKFNDLYKQSIENPEIFWQKASKDIYWFKEPTKILNKSNPPFYKWFEDGVTNTCYNALDVHVDQGNGKRTALIYDRWDYRILMRFFFHYPDQHENLMHYNMCLLPHLQTIYRKVG